MSKIEPLHLWGAKAAIASAQEDFDNDCKIIILCVDKDGERHYRTANMTLAEGMFEMERCKMNMLLEGNL
jgi:hypothetical protein